MLGQLSSGILVPLKKGLVTSSNFVRFAWQLSPFRGWRHHSDQFCSCNELATCKWAGRGKRNKGGIDKFHVPIKLEVLTRQGQPYNKRCPLCHLFLNSTPVILHPRVQRSSGFSNSIYHQLFFPYFLFLKSADAPLLRLRSDRYCIWACEMQLSRSWSFNSTPVSEIGGRGRGRGSLSRIAACGGSGRSCEQLVPCALL